MDTEQSIYLKETNKLKEFKNLGHLITWKPSACSNWFSCLMMSVGKKRNSMFKFCIISETTKEGGKRLSHSCKKLWGERVGKDSGGSIANSSAMFFHKCEGKKKIFKDQKIAVE